MRPRLPSLPDLGLPSVGALTLLFRQLELRAVSRWVGLGLAVGLLSGAAAALLYLGVEFVRYGVLDVLARIEPLEPGGEPRLFSAPGGTPRVWVLVLAPAVAGFLSALLVERFAKEARGGNDGWLRAFHRQRAQVRARVIPVKLLGAALNLGAGASAGREGPIAHVGAAIGSILARALRLNETERRLLLLAGAAGGIGAIFRTPLGGALFVVEVLYTDDIEVDALVPAVLSSVVSYSVFTAIFGAGQLFDTPTDYHFTALQLPLFLVMALGTGLVGVIFVRVHHAVRAHFDGMRLWFPLRSLVAGLLVGALGLLHPSALGAGYGWLQEALVPRGLLGEGWNAAALLLGLAALKVVATSLSTGSGAVAGVFGPSVVIGGLVGGAFGFAFEQLFPTLGLEPSAFALVGMACFVGGVASAPLSTLVMASEMTGSYELLVPIMLAEVISFALLRRYALYPDQFPTRKESPAHGGEYVLDVLQDVNVGEVFEACTVMVIPRSLPLDELLRRIADAAQSVFPVLAPDGQPEGVVTLDSVRGVAYDPHLGSLALATDCESPYTSVTTGDSLAVALERMATFGYPELPVVSQDDPTVFLGLVTQDDVLLAYRRRLRHAQSAGDALESRTGL